MSHISEFQYQLLAFYLDTIIFEQMSLYKSLKIMRLQL